MESMGQRLVGVQCCSHHHLFPTVLSCYFQFFMNQSSISEVHNLFGSRAMFALSCERVRAHTGRKMSAHKKT